MKTKTLTLHLAAHLNQKASTFVELHRALREGLAAELASAQHSAEGFAPPDRPPDFVDAAQTLTGKRGPGGGIIGKQGPDGGLAADPWVVALLTIASLVDAPRSEVARKAFDVFAATAESGTCPLTGATYFGEALMTILVDSRFYVPDNRISVIDISHDAGHVLIHYDGDDASATFVVPNMRPFKASFFVGRLTFIGLRRLHEFIRGNPDFNTEAAEQIEARSKVAT